MFAADSFFKGPGRSLVSAFESTRALSETSGISKAMAGMGAPIKSGSVIDGLFKSVFAADSSFKVNLKSITASFKSTPALAEVSEGIKAASVIGDLLGRSSFGAAIEAALPFQKIQHLNLNELFDFPDYRSPFIAKPESIIVQNPVREIDVLKEIITPEYDREIPDEYEVPVVLEVIFLEDRLRDIDRGLPNLLQGARHALSTDNPDRARHVTVSLRELIGHVLRHLAPDNSIRDWTNDSSYYHGGRPTRKARLLYISREINADDLSEFVNAEVTLAIKLMDLLNGGTHVTASRLTDRQLQALVTRTELLLSFLLHLDSQ